jgi:hypothetical protein
MGTSKITFGGSMSKEVMACMDVVKQDLNKDRLFIDKVLRSLGAEESDVQYCIVMAKALEWSGSLSRKELVEFIKVLY